MAEENVAIRLKHFMDCKSITNSQFADKCGIPRPSLSQLLNGRNQKISDIMVGQIHRAFPELSVLWLLFGEGDMLTVSAADSDLTENQVINADENRISPISDRQADFCCKENGLRMVSDDSKGIGNEPVRPYLETRPEMAKIDISGSVQHRISHITVYYDDSTFETFVPR